MELRIGLKVHYDNGHGKKENGVVKSFHPDGSSAFVVYHCNMDWENYNSYTAALTQTKDLRDGWTTFEA